MIRKLSATRTTGIVPHAPRRYDAGMPWTFNVNNLSRARAWHTRVSRQPGWVIGVTVAAIVLVFVIPLALLAMAALLVGTLVFLVAAAIAKLSAIVTGLLGGEVREPYPTEDGRENVRVIRRE